MIQQLHKFFIIIFYNGTFLIIKILVVFNNCIIFFSDLIRITDCTNYYYYYYYYCYLNDTSWLLLFGCMYSVFFLARADFIIGLWAVQSARNELNFT
jgi:hypothetical protein